MFLVGLLLSMVGLAYAMVTGEEAVTAVKLVLLGGIVACVVGLTVLH